MNKTIIMGLCIISLLLLSGCYPTYIEEDKGNLVDMNCSKLTNELNNRPHTFVRDNELYATNIIGIMNLKGCDLE